jgi:hypothetical protein
MKIKRCLIIDDEDQSSQINTLKSRLKKSDGIDLLCKQINPNDYSKIDPINGNSTFNEAGFFKQIKSILREGVTVIACDNGLKAGNEDIKGYDLICSQIRENMKYKNDVILYSGNLEAVLKEIFENENETDRINQAKKLVKSKITDFVKRSDANEGYIGVLQGLLKKDTFSVQNEISYWLSKLPNHKATFNDFEGKTFEQLQQEIEDDSHLGNNFQKQIIEQGISALINLNDHNE